MRKKSLSEWVEQATQVHGDKLTFSNSELAHREGVSFLVGIQCNRCQNTYTASAHEVVRGSGCPACRPKRRSKRAPNGEKILARARAVASDSIDLDAASAVRRSRVCWLVGIRCRDCDRVYETRIEIVYRGGACPDCHGTRPMGKEGLIQRAKLVYGDTYDYSEVVYVSKRTPVRIGCSVHGIFLQTPEQHLKGTGCMKCVKQDGQRRRNVGNNEQS